MGKELGQAHHDTPKRAKVRGVCQFLEHHQLLGRKKGQVTKEDVFRYFGVNRMQGKKILKCRLDDLDGLEPIPFDPAAVGSDPDSRTLANDPRFRDPRGRPQVPRGQKRKLRDEGDQQLDDHLEDIDGNGPRPKQAPRRRAWEIESAGPDSPGSSGALGILSPEVHIQGPRLQKGTGRLQRLSSPSPPRTDVYQMR